MFKTVLGAFSSTAPAHPFVLGELLGDTGTLGWTQYKATRRDNGAEVSVFVFDSARPGYKDRMALARNALKRFKTLRHPDIVAFVDGAENENQVIIGTDPVIPLSLALSRDPSLAKDQNFIALGLYKIASAIKFLNADVSLTHGNIRISSVYITKSGEWKLGGLDILSNLKDPQPLLIDWGGRMPDSYKYAPPELGNGVWSSAAIHPVYAIDSWAFGCLLHEVFNNGPLPSREALTTLAMIPKALVPCYKHLLNSNPKARIDVATAFEKCKGPNGYFASEFIQACLALEQFSIKESYEKDQFLNKLNMSLESYPLDFCKYKILPELIKALEFGGAGAKALAPILKIGNKLDNAEFDILLVPILIKVFAIPDRAIRVSLCENMSSFIDRINPKVLNEKIFPNLSTGFNDTNAVVRECTLRSVLIVAPKLNERLINNDLLRFLAKLQGDEEPGIRANTTICLGKLASNLNEITRKKVLIAAFARSLHDPFPPARNAGLLAFQATHEYYAPAEIAQKIIPAISHLFLDPERFIRTQAFKDMDIFVKKLEKHSTTMVSISVT
ncbi:armadillo-type protein [Chytriomyces sp. MP71]|nr:armadillo-type protein [Chytriomyces sp. MP71]